MASGVLPSDAPAIERRGGGDVEVRFASPEPSSVCLEPGPQVALFCTARPGGASPRRLRRALAPGAGTMTKTEFLQALDKHEQVKFDGSELRGPTSHASAILSDALMTILPDEEQIRFGVEMSSFTEFTWE